MAERGTERKTKHDEESLGEEKKAKQDDGGGSVDYNLPGGSTSVTPKSDSIVEIDSSPGQSQSEDECRFEYGYEDRVVARPRRPYEKISPKALLEDLILAMTLQDADRNYSPKSWESCTSFSQASEHFTPIALRRIMQFYIEMVARCLFRFAQTDPQSGFPLSYFSPLGGCSGSIFYWVILSGADEEYASAFVFSDIIIAFLRKDNMQPADRAQLLTEPYFQRVTAAREAFLMRCMCRYVGTYTDSYMDNKSRVWNAILGICDRDRVPETPQDKLDDACIGAWVFGWIARILDARERELDREDPKPPYSDVGLAVEEFRFDIIHVLEHAVRLHKIGGPLFDPTVSASVCRRFTRKEIKNMYQEIK